MIAEPIPLVRCMPGATTPNKNLIIRSCKLAAMLISAPSILSNGICWCFIFVLSKATQKGFCILKKECYSFIVVHILNKNTAMALLIVMRFCSFLSFRSNETNRKIHCRKFDCMQKDWFCCASWIQLFISRIQLFISRFKLSTSTSLSLHVYAVTLAWEYGHPKRDGVDFLWHVTTTIALPFRPTFSKYKNGLNLCLFLRKFKKIRKYLLSVLN